MAQILGIDTSNYTTSAALLDLETGEVHQEKQLLPVKAGEAGLRQRRTLPMAQILGIDFTTPASCRNCWNGSVRFWRKIRSALLAFPPVPAMWTALICPVFSPA